MADKANASQGAGAAPTADSPAAIRNVVLIGPSGGGKTTLIEALLTATGVLSTTDGTHNGTTLYADINPTGSSLPSYEAAIGSKVFLTADDGTHGSELMVFTP